MIIKIIYSNLFKYTIGVDRAHHEDSPDRSEEDGD